METSPYFGNFPPMIKQDPLDYYEPPPMYDPHMLASPPACHPLSEAAKAAAAARKRKRKKDEIDIENGDPGVGRDIKLSLKQEKLSNSMAIRKKRDRFNGMTEDEVMARGLPDILLPNLDIVIIGINPGLMAAYIGHHYAGPGNHFWKCLYLSGLIPEPMTAYDDYKLVKFGIGFTNIVQRTTRGSSDLTSRRRYTSDFRKEIKDGGEILAQKIKQYKPKIAVFNGKGIYEVFCGHKNFYIGKQPEPLDGTDVTVYVMPSSSARCSQLPRAIDKVPFYIALKKLRDYVRGDTKHLDDSEVCFPDLELKVKVKNEVKDDEQDHRHDFNGLSLKQEFKSEFDCPQMMHMPGPNFWAPPPTQYTMNAMCGPMAGQFRTFDPTFVKPESAHSMSGMCNLMNSPHSSSFPPTPAYPVFTGMLHNNDYNTDYRLADVPCSAANGLSSPAPQLTTLTTYQPALDAQTTPTTCMSAKPEPDTAAAAAAANKDALNYMNMADSFRPSCAPQYSGSTNNGPIGFANNGDANSLYPGTSSGASPLASASNMCTSAFINSLSDSSLRMHERTQSPCYMTNGSSGSNLINLPSQPYPQYPNYP